MAAFTRHIGRIILWLSLLALLAPATLAGTSAASTSGAPPAQATQTVRVQPAADLSAATFWLEGAPDSLSVRFQSAADGASGTLTLAASDTAAAGAQTLTVKGRNGAGTKTWVGSLQLTVTTTTARTFFVDPVNGSDSNMGSQTKPFKTLTKALAKARAGDTVKLAKGSYSK
jgi:Protein of unknown function (DUF1565)